MLRRMNSADTAPLEPTGRAAATPLRILAADDSEGSRLYLARVLARLGHAARFASNGEEAVQWIRRQPFDLVLMDIMMPVMDGLQATARIRQLEQERPAQRLTIVAYSLLDMPSERDELQRLGLDDVLTKPCTADTLRRCLARWS